MKKRHPLAVLALSSFLFLGFTGSAAADGQQPLGSAKLPAVDLLGDPGIAYVSALPKSRFIRKADRICSAQVPAFVRLRDQLEVTAQRMTEAQEAGQEEVFAAEFRNYGVLIGRLNPLLDKRKKRIQKLRVKPRTKPRAYFRTLTVLSGSLKQLSRAVITLTEVPTQENADRVSRLSAKVNKAGPTHFKAGRKYGFRQCSKKFAVG